MSSSQQEEVKYLDRLLIGCLKDMWSSGKEVDNRWASVQGHS